MILSFESCNHRKPNNKLHSGWKTGKLLTYDDDDEEYTNGKFPLSTHFNLMKYGSMWEWLALRLLLLPILANLSNNGNNWPFPVLLLPRMSKSKKREGKLNHAESLDSNLGWGSGSGFGSGSGSTESRELRAESWIWKFETRRLRIRRSRVKLDVRGLRVGSSRASIVLKWSH